MTEQELYEAAAFYGLQEKARIERLGETLARIQGDVTLAAGLEQARARIYSDSAAAIRSLWQYQTDEELFGCAMPDYATDLLILSGYSRHAAKCDALGYSDAQKELQRFRVGNFFRMYAEKPIPLLFCIWCSGFINGKTTELGRLQYEYHNVDGSLDINEVSLHIPRGEKLTREAVLASLREATDFFGKIYGAESLIFRCHTWLLSPELSACIHEDSNLGFFRSLFDVTPAGNGIPDTLNYVFRYYKKEVDYKELPEDTTLRREIKAYLLGGGTISLGDGILKKSVSEALKIQGTSNDSACGER